MFAGHLHCLTLTVARECNEEARVTWGPADGPSAAVGNGLDDTDREQSLSEWTEYQEAWTNQARRARCPFTLVVGLPINSGQ